MTTSNMNVVPPPDPNQVLVQPGQNNLFNKTMSNMATGINGQGF